MEITIDQGMLDDVRDVLSDITNGYENAIVTSINKTLTTAKTQAAARIGNEVNLKASRIKEDLTINKASYSNIGGSLVATGEPVGLINFGARSVEKGVTVQVLKSSSRTTLLHAFIATGSGSTEHVYWRATDRGTMPAAIKFQVGRKSGAAWPRFGDKYRVPVERLTGPRIEDIFAQDQVMDAVLTQANYLFLTNVEAKVDDILRRHA